MGLSDEVLRSWSWSWFHKLDFDTYVQGGLSSRYLYRPSPPRCLFVALFESSSATQHDSKRLCTARINSKVHLSLISTALNILVYFYSSSDDAFSGCIPRVGCQITIVPKKNSNDICSCTARIVVRGRIITFLSLWAEDSHYNGTQLVSRQIAGFRIPSQILFL